MRISENRKTANDNDGLTSEPNLESLPDKSFDHEHSEDFVNSQNEMFRKQSTKRPQNGKDSLQKRMTPMIPTEQFQKMYSSIAKLKSELNSHIKAFDAYRNNVVQEKNEAQVKFKSIDKEMSKINDTCKQLQQKQEKTKLKLQGVEEHLS